MRTLISGRASDRVTRFEKSWIVLNHYYQTWPTPPPHNSDRELVRAFAGAFFTPHWSWVQKLHSMRRTLQVPFDAQRQNGTLLRVPRGLQATNVSERRAADLDAPDFFEVAYQLRCEDFHGRTGVRGSENEARFAFVTEPVFELGKAMAIGTTMS